MTKIYVGNIRGPAGAVIVGPAGPAGPSGPPGPPISSEGATTGQVWTFDGATQRWLAPVASGGGSGIIGAPSTWPSTFPPSDHTTLITTLRNGTVTLSAAVLALLAATNQQEARTAVGAGTGNGTSTLQLGTSGTTAMPGNKAFGAAEISFTPSGEITATTVQAAILQAAASGGSGAPGVSNILVVKYSSGQYPALPTTKPSGVVLIIFKGPVQPTAGTVSGGIPSYVGDGATQIMADYEYRNLT